MTWQMVKKAGPDLVWCLSYVRVGAHDGNPGARGSHALKTGTVPVRPGPYYCWKALPQLPVTAFYDNDNYWPYTWINISPPSPIH